MDAESRKEAAEAVIMAAVNDDSRSKAILSVTSVFFAISVVSVFLRVFVRTRVVRAFGWDDIAMVLAMVGLAISSKLHHVRPCNVLAMESSCDQYRSSTWDSQSVVLSDLRMEWAGN